MKIRILKPLLTCINVLHQSAQLCLGLVSPQFDLYLGRLKVDCFSYQTTTYCALCD